MDIVGPGSGPTDQERTILTRDSDGRLGEVWVDLGKTTNPSAVQVKTKPQ